jgi:hypothetical protein
MLRRVGWYVIMWLCGYRHFEDNTVRRNVARYLPVDRA